MTIEAHIREGTRALISAKGEDLKTARLEAETLLAKSLLVSRGALLTKGDEDVPQLQEHAYRSFIKRRIANEPVAYIINEREFFGLPFYVNEATLIPRPETEELVECVLSDLTGTERVLDACTGSGCIAITLKKALPELTIVAVDNSKEAIAVAKKNAKAILGNENAVEFIVCDIAQYTPREQFHVLVSNPPYVSLAEYDELSNDVRYEPKTALIAGEKGLDFFALFADNIDNVLFMNGRFYFETNGNQYEAIARMFAQTSVTALSVVNDLSGKQRFVKGKRPCE